MSTTSSVTGHCTTNPQPDTTTGADWPPRTYRISRALDRAHKQHDAAIADGDPDVAAVFRKALDELERIAFGKALS